MGPAKGPSIVLHAIYRCSVSVSQTLNLDTGSRPRHFGPMEYDALPIPHCIDLIGRGWVALGQSLVRAIHIELWWNALKHRPVEPGAPSEACGASDGFDFVKRAAQPMNLGLDHVGWID